MAHLRLQRRPSLHRWNSQLTHDAYLVEEIQKPKAMKPRGDRNKDTTAGIEKKILSVRSNGEVKDADAIQKTIHKHSKKFYDTLEASFKKRQAEQDLMLANDEANDTKPSTALPTLQIPSESTQNDTKPIVARRTNSSPLCPQKKYKSKKKLTPTIQEQEVLVEILERESAAEQISKRFSLPRSSTISKVVRPRYFSNDSKLVFQYSKIMQPIVIAGTKEKLISILVEVGLTDTYFIREFLNTFCYFADAAEVLSALRACYRRINTPEEIKKHNLGDRYRDLTKKRIEYILFVWLSDHPEDFRNVKLLGSVKSLVDGFPENENKISLFTLISNMTIETKDDSRESGKSATEANKEEISFSVLLQTPDVLAEQLCLIEQDFFRKIRKNELIGQKWASENPEIYVPNLITYIEFFNRISYCCKTEILSYESHKKRVKSLKEMIELAERCILLKNYNSAFAIISSLNQTVVSRLEKTWKRLPEKTKELFDRLCEIVSPQQNYEVYKQEMKAKPPPLVPYLGVFLRDLTFLEVGNESFMDEERTMINYDKFRMLASVLQQIVTYQQVPYDFTPDEQMQHTILHCLPSKDENVLYRLSIELEPRSTTTESASKVSLLRRIQFKQSSTKNK